MAQTEKIELGEKLRYGVGRLNPTPLGLGDVEIIETEKPNGTTTESPILFPKAFITCQTDASPLSAIDPVDPTEVKHYVLLRHSLRCVPSVSIKHYKFVIRAIDREGAPGDEIPQLRDGSGAFNDVFSTGLTPGAVLLSSSPSETATLEGRSQTTSHSFGVNVGFFGEVPTGGVNYGYSISDTHSWNIPSTSCSDSSSQDRVFKTFNMNSEAQQKAPFEITFSEIFQLPAKDYTSGNNMRFEVGLAAVSLDNVQFANHKRQIFSVRPPPVPASVRQ